MSTAARILILRAAQRAAVFGHYGTVCACCGTDADLTIDHMNGGGKAHRLELFGRPDAGGIHFYAWLIRQGFPEGYQTLCRQCNRSKGEGPACRLWHGDPNFARCTGICGEVLPLAAFGHHRSGHHPRCRDCRNAADRADYANRLTP